MSEEIKIITLGDIFKNIETEEKAFKFKDYIKDLQQKVEQKDKEIDRLNNIINEVKLQLLNKKDIVEKSKYFKLVYYIDWNMKHEWDKRIANKIDEIINIIDEENK